MVRSHAHRTSIWLQLWAKILQDQEKGRGQRPRPANKADLWGFIVPVAML